MRALLHHESWLGRAARWPLRLAPKDTLLPILTGRNRGLRWVLSSGAYGYWLGRYEARTQAQIAAVLRPGDVAFDIGAHAGFFTLLMARCVGPNGQVHAFEAMPDNVATLRRHIAENGFTNITVHPVAVTGASGPVRFKTNASHSQGRVADDGALTIDGVAIDDLDLPAPRLIKMDIEGGEHLALAGMIHLLTRARPYLLIEGH